ncbi:MAG TPA: XRE family transcriptional regulator, partial [Exiguobacterium sp.]|nr:XRE family transcriptional regulator [Exiguobacterium sp.]
MDNEKIGQFIYTLRKEKDMTQKQLAEALYLSDRTISKWERGIGCPDITLLPHL